MESPDLRLVRVELSFDEEGVVKNAGYACLCGAWIALESVGSALDTHIDHMRTEHSLTPRVRCGLTIPVGHSELRCVLERHGSDMKHSFEL